MLISIDKKKPVPLYLQIRDQIRTMIMSGELTPGLRLPPERKLAAFLSINRGTVVNAYKELEMEGLVESHVGRGTIVCAPNLEAQKAASLFAPEPLQWQYYFNKDKIQKQDGVMTLVAELAAQEKAISFATGIPAPDLYPDHEFRTIINDLLASSGKILFQDCPVEGDWELRRSLVDYMGVKGINTTASNIMVTSGSQQALELLGTLFIEPGDIVVVEEPTYLGSVQLFNSFGAKLLGVPVDSEGMRVDFLENLLARHNPKFIYTIPVFQNPTGTVLSMERREKLLQLAYKYRTPIVEDDPYSELYYDRPVLPPLKSQDRHEYVIYVSTFSKMLFPGIRLGWLVAPEQVINRLAHIKKISDLHTNTLSQWALNAFYKKGHLKKHLQKIRPLYAGRRDTMLKALEPLKLLGVNYNFPQGGLYLWCELPDGVDSAKLIKRALEKKVAFIPGQFFYSSGEGKNFLRLNFSHGPEEKINEGINRLHLCIREQLKELENSNGILPAEKEVKPLI